MSWRKYFKTHNSPLNPDAKREGSGRQTSNLSTSKFSSILGEVYTGTPNRIDRYAQYDQMNQDSEINAALDTIAEFCTQFDAKTETPFDIKFSGTPNDTEVKVLKKTLKQWCRINEFDMRLFRMIRSTIMYGDQFFIRDPETFEWIWLDPTQLTKIIINQTKAKEPEQYVVKNLGLSLFDKTGTDVIKHTNQYMSMNSVPGISGNPQSMSTSGYRNFGSSSENKEEVGIDSAHMIHFSMTEGMDLNWPFGTSLLEPVFKIFKQKELLEDSIIIYRVQRAPERRIFYIDVGNMPSHMAMSFVERVKNEIHQRRIPSRTGGGQTVMDSSYNPMCLDLSTRIPLLDGRKLALHELIEEYKNGKENWAYSCDPETGKVVPGVITWAGVTRTDTDVIKLTFDNGKTLICTPDHKIPVFGKGFVEAKDLLLTDSLIAFNTKTQVMPGSKNGEYQQVWDHESKTWKWTHRVVGDYFRERNNHQEFTYLEENVGKVKAVVHHKDSDRFNNDPRNLAFMNKEDHILFHASQKKEFWNSMTPEYRTSMTTKISATLKKYWADMTTSEKDIATVGIKAAQKKSILMRQTDPDVMASYKKNASSSRKAYFLKNPAALAKCIDNFVRTRVPFRNQEVVLTFEMLQIVSDIVKSHGTNKKVVIQECNKNTKLLTLVRDSNADAGNSTLTKIDFSKFGQSKIDRLLTKFGYKNWKHFVKSQETFNHKIVSIEPMSSRDVGTLTIDGKERWNNYHTFAIESGIFVKNSMMEDYFFAQTADGRGSKVETLPGGDNLGQIDDLKFFTNKMMRALRIPSSYMPTGPDDGTAAYNDGKVGTAFIQEYRFNKYCMRIQSLLAPIFDREFKLFLKFKGVEIDASTFDLGFVPPQNFAAYREIELNSSRVSIFGQMADVAHMSKRFVMKKYLNLDEDEIIENERMWLEENPAAFNQAPAADLMGDAMGGAINTNDLGSVGIVPPPEGEAPEGEAPEGEAPEGAAPAISPPPV